MENNKNLFKLIKNHEWDKVKKYVGDTQLDYNIRDDNGNYLMTYAILYNKIDVVKLLVDKDAKIDIVDADGMSILYTPIKYGYSGMVKYLLEVNKKQIGIPLVDIKDMKSNIPLHYAIKYKRFGIVKLLLESGSDPNTLTNAGINALHLAIHSKSFEITKLVAEHISNVSERITVTGETALHLACNFEETDTVKLLIEKGIDVNVQDTDNEFTALNYSINLNNRIITELLLDAGADPNLQDFYGNTSLHYAIMEDNHELFNLLLEHSKTKDKININLYNADGNIPLHQVFIGNQNVDSYTRKLLDGSNLNIQNNEGHTIMHFLSVTGNWKNHKDVLDKKKMNIYVKNNDKFRPIDYIKKPDRDTYIMMVAKSYLYQIRRRDVPWEKDWENSCKKGEDSKCLGTIKRKLVKLSNRDCVDVCRDASFPKKKGSVCIEVVDGKKRSDFCTFTGITLDILVGVIYLANKHSSICSILKSNFVENQTLCNYYKSMGISSNAKCEFMNFEIVWLYGKLYVMEDFANSVKMCLKARDKTFIIVPLGIELKAGSHANYLILNIKKMELERFEPHGSNVPYKFNYSPKLLDSAILKKFKEILPDVKYFPPKTYLPRIGFQLFDSYESNCKKIGDPGGFCAIWTVWYVDMRITYKDIDRKKLVKKMIKAIKRENVSFKNLIRNYADNIVNIRDEVLNKAEININDWINNKYTDKQMDNVIDELANMIDKINE